jgi:hypothetical protein
MAKVNKKGYMIYTFKICYNEETEEVKYLAEGFDEDDTDFTPFNPFDMTMNMTKVLTSEDMEAIKELYDIPES